MLILRCLSRSLPFRARWPELGWGHAQSQGMGYCIRGVVDHTGNPEQCVGASAEPAGCIKQGNDHRPAGRLLIVIADLETNVSF